jgi:hypothetical protein
MGFFQSIFTSPPEIVCWGQNDTHLFAFAVGTDHALWYAQLDGFAVVGNTNAWSEWRSLGASSYRRARALSRRGGRREVLAIAGRVRRITGVRSSLESNRCCPWPRRS